ncbi:MAG: hypothetical protein ACO25B_08535 [Chitinophagaceae bacterium]
MEKYPDVYAGISFKIHRSPWPFFRNPAGFPFTRGVLESRKTGSLSCSANALFHEFGIFLQAGIEI